MYDLGERPQLDRQELIFFFTFTELGFWPPHHGPVLTKNTGAQTTNKDGERHTSHEKSSNTFSSVMRAGPSAPACTHVKTVTLISLSLTSVFWFLVSQAFGTNIYTSCTFIRESDTVRQRRWYCVPLSKGLLIHGAGCLFCCSQLVTHRSLHATTDWHCLGHSRGQCG